MGVLGEYPTDTMFAKLKGEIKKWQAADSTIPVIPALHYIAVTAQGYPGKGNKYRLRMPYKQIDSVIRMAARINALVFLDIQVGQSTVQEEVPLLETLSENAPGSPGYRSRIFNENREKTRNSHWNHGCR